MYGIKLYYADKESPKAILVSRLGFSRGGRTTDEKLYCYNGIINSNVENSQGHNRVIYICGVTDCPRNKQNIDPEDKYLEGMERTCSFLANNSIVPFSDEEWELVKNGNWKIVASEVIPPTELGEEHHIQYSPATQFRPEIKKFVYRNGYYLDSQVSPYASFITWSKIEIGFKSKS